MMQSSSSPALACTNLTKTFRRMVVPSGRLQDRLLNAPFHRKAWSINAVDNVSLSVKQGEWVGIYGHNGSGKTTLLRILAGLMPQDAGTVVRSRPLACFFDLGAGFHLERRAEENIFFHGLLHGLHRKDINALIPRIIEFAGVGSHADLPLKCYSTGMRMRLAFAVVAHIDTDIYLWDEVAAVGDSDFQKKCIGHLRSLKARGKSAVLVSHGMGDLRTLCDRIIYMQNGRIVQEERISSPDTSV
jgi:ABC-type polysaccharide/polyol phosphate transport system ATPase subunit